MGLGKNLRPDGSKKGTQRWGRPGEMKTEEVPPEPEPTSKPKGKKDGTKKK